MITDVPCSRWLFALASLSFHVCRLDPSLARNAGPPLRPTILVREIAHVLDTGGLGSVLCGMDTQFPARAARQCEHKRMGYCMRKYDCSCCRGSCGSMGTHYAQANTCGCREAAPEARSHGIQRQSETCREEGTIVVLPLCLAYAGADATFLVVFYKYKC